MLLDLNPSVNFVKHIVILQMHLVDDETEGHRKLPFRRTLKINNKNEFILFHLFYFIEFNGFQLFECVCEASAE